LTAGGTISDQAGAIERRRLITDRDALARMEINIDKAKIKRDELNKRGNLEGMLDMQDPANVAIFADLAADLLSAERARGEGIANEAQRGALDMVLGSQAPGAAPLDVDAVTALTAVGSNKLLTPNNVDIRGQSQAKIDALEALMRQRDAAAAKSGREDTGVTRASAVRLAMFMQPEEFPAFAEWSFRKRQQDPDRYNDENQMVVEWAALKNTGADPLADARSFAGDGTGPPDPTVDPTVDAAATAVAGVPDGKTPQTAIPVESLTEEPPIDTWVIQNGVTLQYKGQRQ
jgi:hypothetical protein